MSGCQIDQATGVIPNDEMHPSLEAHCPAPEGASIQETFTMKVKVTMECLQPVTNRGTLLQANKCCSWDRTKLGSHFALQIHKSCISFHIRCAWENYVSPPKIPERMSCCEEMLLPSLPFWRFHKDLSMKFTNPSTIIKAARTHS